MERIAIDSYNFLEFRPTPWDTRAFGFPTSELLAVKYSDAPSLDRLLDLFDARNGADGVRLSYVRADAGDNPLKLAMQLHGFYYAETSLLMSWNGRDSSSAFAPRTGFVLQEPNCEADFERIREISRDCFFYGRFHEDPAIPAEKARLRYYLWIDDMRRQGARFLVYKMDGRVQSFLAYAPKDEGLELILTGTDSTMSFLGCYFWPAFMRRFAEEGYKRVTAVVSVANLNAVNLYSRLNFECEKAMIGFHKVYG